MRIVVTGGNGFIGRNLRVRLRELGYDDVIGVGRETTGTALSSTLASADFVVHLAGVNRPIDPAEFDSGNRGLTSAVCAALRQTGRKIPLVLSSSTHAALDNPYGVSKRGAEIETERYAAETGSPVYRFRLTNVFGKWSQPSYNSAVATFCHNISRGLPIAIHDPAAPLRLVYIDDVVEAIIRLIREPNVPGGDVDVQPIYATTVGDVAALIQSFHDGRQTGRVPHVGTGLMRALYATYTSFLPVDQFAYPIVQHTDPRGTFAELLRTPDCGQISFFTAHPGVTRGGHYHHSKTEKFLVVKGRANFRFRHIVTGERHELVTTSAEARVVETAPGWAHDITNIGDDEMIVMLWANEAFDPAKPDTVAAAIAD